VAQTLSSCWLDGCRAGPFGGEFHRVTVKVVDVDAGVDDARNTVRLGADAVAGKLPQPSARPVAWRHRARAILCKPEAMRSEITVDTVVKLFFYEYPE
jgi:hypothetical protein